MAGHFTIARVLGGISVTTFAVLTAVGGLYGERLWSSYRDATTFEAVDRATDSLLVALDHLTNERGLTQSALMAPEPAKAEQISGIIERRARMQEAVQVARDGLAGTGGVPALQPVLEKMASVEALRREADAALKQSKDARPETLLRDWYPKVTATIGALRGVWNELTFDNSSRDALVGRYNEIKFLAGELRESAGRERALIGGAIAGGTSLNAQAHARALSDQARVEVAWRRLRELTPAQGSADLADAIAAAEKQFFTIFAPERDRILKALAAAQSAELSSKDWSDRSNPALASFVGVRDAAIAAGRAHTAAMHAQAMRGLLVLGALALVGLVVTVAAFWVVRARITGPIARLCETMTRIARGDAERDVPGLDRADEIGDMARSVEVFKASLAANARLEREAEETRARQEAERDEARRREAEQLSAAQATLERRLGETEAAVRNAEAVRASEADRLRAEAEAGRKAAMNELADAFEASVRAVVSGVNETATRMRDGSATMSDTAEETAQQAGTVASASEQASGNVQTVAAASEELSASIQEIGRQVSQSAQMAQAATERAKRTGARVDELAEAALKIGEVVSLINSIASQTNLLALNATIEAARAGEAGKGFAVVASEVKALANQTAKATEEISRQIDAVQTATHDAVEAIREIAGSIDEISGVASSIASAVEEQTTATQDISRNVQQAAQGTEEVSGNIGAVTLSARKTGSVADGMRTASELLAAQADTLSTEVSLFVERIRAA